TGLTLHPLHLSPDFTRPVNVICRRARLWYCAGLHRTQPHRPEPVLEQSAEPFASRYLESLRTVLGRLDMDALDEAIALVRSAWERDGQVITLGNGGSAMTALHFATDWSKGVFGSTGRRFRARSLLDNMGVVSAYANDISYADIFAEQLRNIAVPGDL